MHDAITRLLAADHDRLDALLAEATAEPGAIEPEAFARFRKGLLRHIGMEEKILFPAARKANGDVPLEAFSRLRDDHARIVALLVPTPTPALVAELRAVLGPHNTLEEAADGVYAQCERLVADKRDELLARLADAPEVPVRPHVDHRRPLILGDAQPAPTRPQDVREGEET